MEISVVIPAYNEEDRLRGSLERIVAFLAERADRSEVLVVDDGSRDHTSSTARENQGAGIRVLMNERNRGKGFSVRRGMLEARFDPILFTDADLSTPIEELPKLQAALFNTGAGVAFASRAAPGAVLKIRQPFHREAMGRAFNIAVRALALPGIRDTQCGFKLFTRRAARRIFPLVTIERFGFDVEALFIARRLGIPTVEVPVTWLDSPSSRVHPLRDGLRMLADLVRVRARELQGCYEGEPAEDGAAAEAP